MKKTIRWTALAAAAILALGLCACSSNDNTGSTTPPTGTTDEKPDDSAATAGDTASGLVILDETLAAEEYGIGFRKGDVTRDVVDAALKVLKAEGKVEEISNQWFGYDLTTIEGDAAALDGLDTQEGRTFILGLDDSFPPMGYRDENNNVVGFDIDLAQAVCDKLGWTLQIQPIDWSAKEMELESGNIDCIWNGMTLTSERLEAMDCSAPYMANTQVLVVRAAEGYTSKADLAGKKLALQTGSSAEAALDSDADFKDSLASVVTFDTNLNCFMDLEQGSVDAVLVDSIVAGWYIQTGNL